jgi:hypothetical protein
MKNNQSLTATARQSWLDGALEELTAGRSPAEVLAGMIDELHEHKRDLAKGEKDAAEFITDRRTLTAILSEATKLHAEKAKDSWRTHFESAGEIKAGPPVWLIENWLMKGTTMALSGLPELCRALLTGEPLFGKLAVGERADILYLIPEMSRGMFFARQQLMRAGTFEDRFLSQTLDRPRLDLSNPITLAAASERVVVIDTARRYLTGQTAQDAANFSAQCYGLLAGGAKAVVILFHSAKPGRFTKDATLQNSISDSVEHGAQVATAYALKVEDKEKGVIRVTNTKNSHRAEGHTPPFFLRARPDLTERGEFTYLEDANKSKKARHSGELARMLKAGKSTLEIKTTLGVSANTISRHRKRLETEAVR